MKSLISLLAVVLFATISTAAADRVWFVDEGAPGLDDGSSWEDAFVDLQDALAVAQPGDEIRVAQGVYKPTDVPGDRLATFQLDSGVAVRGGYAGFGEKDPDRRDITAFETTLSCDINDDDIRLENGLIEQNQENCHHVVTGSGTDESAVIEGFTIRGGNANGCDFPHYYGGGMLNIEGSPTVTRCRFIRNSGGFSFIDCPNLSGLTNYGAGGMYNDRAHPTVTNCEFHQNVGLDICGGMQNVQSSPTVTGCTFTENTSLETSRGAAVLSRQSNTTLIDCCFERHRTGAVAGDAGETLLVRCVFDGNVPGAFFFTEGRATLTDCVFTGNGQFGRPVVEMWGGDAVLTGCRFDDNRSLVIWVTRSVLEIRDSEFVGNGHESASGGIRGWDRSNLTIVGCTFRGNTSSNLGGAIEQDTGELTVADSVFDGNWAEDDGGAINANRAVVTIERCIFVDNCASKNAGDAVSISQSRAVVSDSLFAHNWCSGALDVGWWSVARVTNCTFVDNRAWRDGASGLSVEGGVAVVSNCILHGNHRQEERDESAQISNDNGLLSINYSCVQGWTGNLGGTGNIGDDPQFVDPEGGDHRLLPGSPVIDAADNTVVPPQVLTDLDGNPRLADDPDTEDTGNGACPVVDMGAYEFQAEGGCCSRDPRWMCDGDVDGDGQVNPVDSGLVQAAFGSLDEQDLCNYDLDCGGQINPVDSGIVQSLFGTCDAPGDSCP